MKGKIRAIWAAAFICAVCFLLPAVRVRAAFPVDMEKKPVWAYPITLEEINYYRDEKLTKLEGSISGNGLKLVAVRASERGLYGTFEDGNKKKKAWFDQADFIYDMDYEHEYATVRAPMLIYTDESFDQVRDEIRKYSGVIAVSNVGENRQVIYEKKDHYGIGWMTEGSYSDTLIYDGREKQDLRDGVYQFQAGYLDSKKGGLEDQSWLDKYPAFKWKLIHAYGDLYEIYDPETETFLTTDMDKKGARPVWRTESGERAGLFRIERGVGAFTIESLIARNYLTSDQVGNLSFELDGTTFKCHWRIRALKKIQPNKDPFVITQYDPDWCATPYGGGGCMGTAGCGILAPVNAVYALTGQYMDVMELADYAVEKNYRIVDNGTDDGIFKASCKAFGKKYGYAWDGQSGSLDTLKKKLLAGDVAVVHVQGHYVAVTAYNKKRNRYLMLDSNYLPKREDTPFGDWIKPQRLLEGALEAQTYYFFRLRKK